MGLLQKLFGTHSEREIRRITPIVSQIEELATKYAALSEEDLKETTELLRARLAEGVELDDLLPDAFAAVREASRRVLGMYHFQVQLIGGVVLHQGRIAEMKTGEGKTLVATLPVYLNALTGKGVHVVTVNDYLARRDSEWMGKIYRYLGLSVGLIVHGMDNDQRRAAYACDVTYGTNNEFGFDYLRDNMVMYLQQCVQRPLNFAIVDEVDSILIDEARTPLFISGEGEASSDLYERADKLVRRLKPMVVTETDAKVDLSDITEDADYIVDEKAKTAVMTPSGVLKAEKFFNIENLSDTENYEINHHINNALKAHGTMHRDQQYVVKDDEIVIVDDFTGRLMLGRRYSNGLHQAIEAKENVKVEKENKTLATITFQNYFRMYKKLSGMTGTALTEEDEFRTIYSLDVISIPTNQPMVREDRPDAIYKTQNGKYKSLLEIVREIRETGQPILIGTVSVERSEMISELFRRNGIPHNVLNAKQHEREAEIVAQAGRIGAVTIATNMAGRGTDILLGGNPEFMTKQELRKQGFDEELIEASTAFNETTDPQIIDIRRRFKEINEGHAHDTALEHKKVVEAGGLAIIGTERHESRRIDNQLRGRSGRQGDPGSSQFFLSLEDDLLRLFGGERMTTIFNTLGVEEDMQLENKMLSGAIETAQKRVEARNFSIRKHVLEYDDVMNKQRELIYGQRRQVLEGADLRENYRHMITDMMRETMLDFCSELPDSATWDIPAIDARIRDLFGDLKALNRLKDARNGIDAEEFTSELTAEALDRYTKRENEVGNPELMREIERVILLRTVDAKWMDHIDAMDELRDTIGMRSYAQHDPIIEYKREGFEMFEAMNKAIQEDSVRLIMRARFNTDQNVERRSVARNITAGHGGSGYAGDESGGSNEQGRSQIAAAPLAPSRSSRSSRGSGSGGGPAIPGAATPHADGAAPAPARRDQYKAGRNDPCPCGSGKKYKNCHGRG
ncbi:MAG: preprotein translocase subunit SecA [Ruminococcaceae bacterium]|nr:preprotein translocase subunit SecA [Oscillospiraceae bacterium]